MRNRRKNRGTWAGLLRFDEPDGAYELLETEVGYAVKADRDAETDPAGARIPTDVREVAERFDAAFRTEINHDLIRRHFRIGGRIEALAVFLNGMADAEQIADFILRPAMSASARRVYPKCPIAYIERNVFPMQETELTERWEDVVTAVSEGRTAVFVTGDDRAILMDTRGYPSRSVSTPQNEVVILGPHEAFTENLRTNISLLRRIIRTEDFVAEFRGSGGRNGTRLAILYREGVANSTLVNEVKRRLAGIDTLAVLSTGMIEQMIESHPNAPFPQALSTERPDRAAALLMNGHIAVLLDGSPLALILPATLFTLMSAGEDIYLRKPTGTIVRVVRYAGAILSVLMPAYFLALAMHHQGMLSSEVLSTVIASRNMVFLPLPFEMIFLLFVFQFLRQASVSVPGAMGQSIGIIGGLVLGQAAVSANFVSKVVLILVAMTGLGNFCIPDYNTQLAIAYYRILLVLAAWLGGLIGMVTVLIVTVAALSSMKSFGVPYLTPIAPKTNRKGPLLRRGRLRNSRKTSDWTNTTEECV